jgi:predicted transcriptional regulator
MAVISVRLNKEEEKIIDYLSSVYDEDKSTLIKHSLNEMYEDFVDKKIIDDYELSEKKKKPKFVNSEDILKEIV